MTIKKIVYAGSFDPVTNGHLWIINQLTAMFDEVIVVVGTNSDKQYWLPMATRLDLLQQVTKNLANVSVKEIKNQYLIDFATMVGAKYLARGIRNMNDYQYEYTMHNMNYDLNPNITTIFLLPPKFCVDISSSLVKGLLGTDNWENVVVRYVPDAIYQFLKQKYSKLDVEQVKK
jgi:pantetheine-phosphate adenylyltransferase